MPALYRGRRVAEGDEWHFGECRRCRGVGLSFWRARFFAAAQNDRRANAGERRAFVRRSRAASVASAPARAFGPVFERDAELGQPVADAVGELELPGGTQVVAELHEQVDERLRADTRLS